MVFEDEGHGFTKRANQDKAHARIIAFLTEQLLA
jgi:dipeptidyl aminopeptidase/acylaminoacyl peptidase